MNKEYPGLRLEKSNTNRHFYRITSSYEERKNIRKKVIPITMRNNPLKTKVEEYDISLIIKNEKFDKSMDCKRWALYETGLGEHAKEDFWGFSLIHYDLKDIKWIPEPEVGSIVTYFDSKSIIPDGVILEHWGVVSGINRKVMVDSKWGLGPVYRHPIEYITATYPANVMFFKSLSTRSK